MREHATATEDRADAFGAAEVDTTVVRLATAAAAVFLGVLFVSWLMTGDTGFLVKALAPVAVGGTGVAMLAAGRPRAVLQIVVGTFSLVLFGGVGDAAAQGGALMGLLVMSIAGSALVRRRSVAFIASAATVIAGAAFAWQPDTTAPTDRTVASFSAVAAFLIAAGLLQWLKSRSAADRERLRELIDSKDEFVATISHELRTPLTAVVGLAHELNTRLDDFSPAEVAEFAELLAAEASDVAGIIEDLLVAARADVGGLTLELRELDVIPILRAAAADLDRAPVEGSEGPVIVAADPLRLRQIVRNLIGNATRYGGDHVRVVAVVNGATVRIEVRDDGPPLPAPDREQVFEPYHRAAAIPGKPGSVGLGLTVSRKLARLMGGDVAYEHDGAETVFTLELPVVATPVSAIGTQTPVE